jgi:hypothetical protein
MALAQLGITLFLSQASNQQISRTTQSFNRWIRLGGYFKCKAIGRHLCNINGDLKFSNFKPTNSVLQIDALVDIVIWQLDVLYIIEVGSNSVWLSFV